MKKKSFINLLMIPIVLAILLNSKNMVSSTDVVAILHLIATLSH